MVRGKAGLLSNFWHGAVSGVFAVDWPVVRHPVSSTNLKLSSSLANGARTFHSLHSLRGNVS